MIWFVGAGPGDPGLITLKGLKLIQGADLIIYAGSLINPEILSYAGEDCRLLDSALLTLEEITEELIQGEKEGKSVVRLHSGDPALYGAIREQFKILDEKGISYECCPGVSSLFGAAASLKKEFMIPGKSQSLIITRCSGRTPVPEEESLETLAAHRTSIAVFLSAGMADKVSEELIKGGYPEDTPSAIVYRATWDDEKIIYTSLKDLGEAAKNSNIDHCAILFVGEFLKDDDSRSKLYHPDFSTKFRKGNRKSFISIISFTDAGDRVNLELSEYFRGEGKEVRSASGRTIENLKDWTEEAFNGETLIFIGAAGIAFRSAAPFIKGKGEDPAVLVIDEKKRFVIPVLSGHYGANSLAKRVAEYLGSEAVITTATDINGCFAVDSWAREKGFKILNPEKIKLVSASLLRGEAVRFLSLIHSGRDALISDGVPEEAISEDREAKLGVKISPYLNDDFPETLHVIPPCLVLGIGCRKGTDPGKLREFILKILNENEIAPEAVTDIASIDVKRDEEAIRRFAEEFSLNAYFYSAEELNDLPNRFSFEDSEFVENTVGCGNVCERSAVKRALQYAGAGDASILVKKSRGEGMTAALAFYIRRDAPLPVIRKDAALPVIKEGMPAAVPAGRILIIGTGPGNEDRMSNEAVRGIEESDLIVGYDKYLKLIRSLTSGKEVFATGMGGERERCLKALSEAEKGRRVALISDGDPGVYGMAGLVYELNKGGVEIRVIPGITAALSGGALLGAPLMNDFACISLSDRLTPFDTIERRLRAAAEGDMVTVLYNPGSRGRKGYLKKACEIFLNIRPPETVCGYVKNIAREGEEYEICTLAELKDLEPDMSWTCFIGNSDTRVIGGRMVTVRGYGKKDSSSLRSSE